MVFCWLRRWFHIKKLGGLNCLDIDDIYKEIRNMSGFARVVSVYDGDSPNIVFWHRSLRRYIRMRVRMAHYDTAEIRGTTEIERELAVQARDRFMDLVNFSPGTNRNTKYNRRDSTSDIIFFRVVGMDTQWSRPVVMMWNINEPSTSINAIIHSECGVDYEGKTKNHRWGEARDVHIDYDEKLSYS